jgi:hypothetical protein
VVKVRPLATSDVGSNTLWRRFGLGFSSSSTASQQQGSEGTQQQGGEAEAGSSQAPGGEEGGPQQLSPEELQEALASCEEQLAGEKKRVG